jgi:PIN domain nuclease of toxin-antitoxin system
MVIDASALIAYLRHEAGYQKVEHLLYNLSLGDSACLALAEICKVGILTAEASWSKLSHLPIKVTVIG